jgi:polyisoprenyl-phosphate glycosyltransferase
MKHSAYLSVVAVFDRKDAQAVEQVQRIHEVVGSRCQNYEIVVVVNGGGGESTHNFSTVLKPLSHTTILINLPHQYPREIAGYVGLEYAKGDVILELEHANLTVTEALVDQLFQESEKGFDIVSLIPKEDRSTLSTLFYRVLSKTAFVPLELQTEYARLVTRRGLNALLGLKHRTKYRKLLYAYTGFCRSTIVLDRVNDKAPVSVSRTPKEGMSLAVDVFITYTNLAVRITLMLALMWFLFSIGGGIYALMIYYIKDVTVEGWTTLMLFMSFGLSGLFLMFAIVVKYLELILRETQSAPLYVTRSVDIIGHDESHPHV